MSKLSSNIGPLIEVDLREMGLSDIDNGLLCLAQEALAEIEAGAIANVSEGRMVGHYWLRNPSLAPEGLGDEIEASIASVKNVSERVLGSGDFRCVLLIGIGGSALGTQLLYSALGVNSSLKFEFIDNTDPQGMVDTIKGLDLATTLVLVVSKSGGTAETMNGMRTVMAAYADSGVDFDSRAVAITREGSKLHNLASTWFGRVPQFEWVGGRTSVLSPVGLLPASLMGIDIGQLLAGAAAVDQGCRESSDNPANLMALSWFQAATRGEVNMVVLPYRDSLSCLGRYLQQLIMESVGKRLGSNGELVEQGLAVYGNKGSTDQHAFIQQLVAGRRDSFATFIVALSDPDGQSRDESGNTPGEHLLALMLGTRRTLARSGRHSATIVLKDVTPASMGGLIALFERAVGAFAAMVGINAYDQPGVEAGKLAASSFLGAMRGEAIELNSKDQSLIDMFVRLNRA